MEGEEDDFDNDFIRKPKFFHSTPRLSSFLKDKNSGLLSASPCDNISPVSKPPVEFFNPFSPDGKVVASASKVSAQKKFKRLCISELPPKLNLDDSCSSENLPQSDGDTSLEIPKRPRLRDMNVSRFNEEFILLEEIGKGVHGCVYKCLNRMNGIVYAVKRTLLPLNSGFQEKSVRNEIYAHGILNHPNIVCNFSSWIEEGYAFIQNEYCDLGSLEAYVKDNVLSENLLRSLLLQMAQALHYLHSKGLAHMDLKPGNILIKSELTEDDDSGVGEKIDDLTFKLGDFGHVTSLDEEIDVEEGDCRYLPREILEGNLKNLNKSDIFSLGLTVYEVSGGGPLPKNGEEWQEIRNGKLRNLDSISSELNNILKSMVHPEAEKRPSALNLIKILKLSQSHSSHVEDDLSFFHQFYHKHTRLEHKVETAGYLIRELFNSHRQLHDQLHSGMDSSGYHSRDMSSLFGKRSGGVTESRIVGKKAKRSNSTLF